MAYEIKPLSCDPKKLKGTFREADREPLGEQLRRCREALECYYRTARLAGLRHSARVPRQRPQARRVDRHELDDPARAVLRWAGCRRGTGSYASRCLVRDFGSVERWRSEFVAMGKAMGGGSGWVLLTYSTHDERLVNQWA